MKSYLTNKIVRYIVFGHHFLHLVIVDVFKISRINFFLNDQICLLYQNFKDHILSQSLTNSIFRILHHELELISIYVLFHKTAQSLLTIAFDSVQQLA